MSIYESFVGSITDRVVDDAVDNTIDTVKNKVKLQTTYVWTAINRETHDHTLANLTFINKLGQRRRVAYNDIEDFCKNNYVSNVIWENNSPKILGCSMNDLPEYRLHSDCVYRLYAKYDENYIYNKAYGYIQSQERKIQEDANNGCLRGNTTEPTKTNLTSNISAIKDISTATAVTAVTTAGVATATGIGLAARAIYKKLNSKQIVEMQSEMCKSLGKISELVEILIKMKYRTNNYIREHSNITEYNNILEASSELSNRLVNEVKQYGVVGCTKTLCTKIEQIRSKAEANKIITEKLKNNSNIGTLQAYIDSIYSRINIIKQEHNTTRRLINNNRQIKYNIEQANIEAEQIRQFQSQLYDNISQIINNLEIKISRYEAEQLDDSNVDYIAQSFNNSDIMSSINDANNYLNQLADENNRNNFRNRLTDFERRIDGFKDNTIRTINGRSLNNKNIINADLSYVETKINELIACMYSGNDYVNVMNDINDKLAHCKSSLSTLLDIDRDLISTRIDSIEDKLKSNKNNIENAVNKANNDRKNVNSIQDNINKFTDEIDRAKFINDTKGIVSRFNSAVKFALEHIYNIELQNEYRQKIDDTVSYINTKIDTIERLQNEEKDRVRQIGLNLLNEIRQEISRIESTSDKITTQQDIDSFIIDIGIYEDSLLANQFEAELKRDIRSAIGNLKSKYSSKKRSMEYNLSNIDKAKERFYLGIEDLKLQIQDMNKYSKDRLLNKINKLSISDDYNKLLDKDSANAKITELLNLYNAKITELNI